MLFLSPLSAEHLLQGPRPYCYRWYVTVGIFPLCSYCRWLSSLQHSTVHKICITRKLYHKKLASWQIHSSTNHARIYPVVLVLILVTIGGSIRRRISCSPNSGWKSHSIWTCDCGRSRSILHPGGANKKLARRWQLGFGIMGTSHPFEIMAILLINVLKILGITLMVLHCLLTKYGTGHHQSTISAENLETIYMLAFAIQIIYQIVLGTTKIGICTLFLCVFQDNTGRRIMYGTVAFIAVYTTALTFASVFQCNPISRAWKQNSPGSCINFLGPLCANGICNIAVDALLMIFIFPRICKFQSQWSNWRCSSYLDSEIKYTPPSKNCSFSRVII